MFLFNKKFRALFIFLCVFFACNCYALNKNIDFNKIYNDYFKNNQKALSAEIQKMYNLPKVKADIGAQMMSEAFANTDCIVSLLYDAEQLGYVDENGILKSKKARSEFMKYANYWIQNKQFEGMKYIPIETLKKPFETHLNSIKMLKKKGMFKACRAIGFSDFSNFTVSEMLNVYSVILNNMSVEEFKNNAIFSRNNIIAASNKEKHYIPLTQQEVEIAENAFVQSVSNKLSLLPLSVQQSLVNVENDRQSASEKDLCDYSIFITESILDIKGNLQNLVIRYLMQQSN